MESEGGTVAVSFEVRNTGRRGGIAVPQLYVRDEIATVVRPVKELKAFGRLELSPGESKRVTFSIPTDMLNFTSATGARIVEPGVFDLMIGASSSDIRLRAIVTLTGPVRTLGREWRMLSKLAVGLEECRSTRA